ncbi:MULTISPECIES: hypothetical protein [unclassified Rhodococcus (in: high G+C Gram-positive bacteria)]|uniref:hypothetical protein n=1 Tax=unclassified Rhodococcus (in: high G+C Gram-positive bacteria) TaxID=192944 RepID=UPI0006FBE82E|nr:MULTISPECIES: hypothetical protein [unclassified Rhodococcus (in: high G+C Gram-positive bacteria)]KQU36410.1 hypothetical protein ASG69_19440 [Rhodococcus sp. Leaf225]KQU48956.1 hypothetical protein ASH03_03905 [Rhodococcus sp. Leaf258]
MSANELTGTEVSVLMVLMAEARAVRNPELSTLGPELKKPHRDHLASLGLIEVGKQGRTMTVELTDKGWKHCSDLMGTQAPKGAAGPGKALFTVMAGLGRWFHRDDVRPAEVFFPRDTPTSITAPPTPPNAIVAPAVRSELSAADVEQRIRSTYADLAREPGAWVRLSRLRPALSDISRTDLDEALARLRRAPDASLIPEENQKTLTDEDRAAAVDVGNQQNHLLAIEQ